MSGDVDRRIADQEFKESIREKLAIIFTQQEVMRTTLEEIRDRLENLEDTYRGGMGTAGVDERIREVERAAREHEALIIGSPITKNGIKPRLEALETGDMKEVRRVDLTKARWMMWTSIIVAGIGLLSTWGPKVVERMNEKPQIHVPRETRPKPVKKFKKRPPPVEDIAPADDE